MFGNRTTFCTIAGVTLLYCFRTSSETFFERLKSKTSTWWFVAYVRYASEQSKEMTFPGVWILDDAAVRVSTIWIVESKLDVMTALNAGTCLISVTASWCCAICVVWFVWMFHE